MAWYLVKHREFTSTLLSYWNTYPNPRTQVKTDEILPLIKVNCLMRKPEIKNKNVKKNIIY